MTTPTSIDKYQIIKPLGSGNFGQVFHAFDRALMTEKAIKVLKVTDPTQFLQHLEEAQILKVCTHKHIVTINEANIFPVNGDNRVGLRYTPSSRTRREPSNDTTDGHLRDGCDSVQGGL